MTRRTFFEPQGKLGPALVIDALGLASVELEPAKVQAWTELELLVAYDWAIREHLSAGDCPVRRRTKPSFVTAAERVRTRDQTVVYREDLR